MPWLRNSRSAVAQALVAGGDHAALAGRDRLDGVEREHRHVGVPAVADRSVGAARAERVRGVLDHDDVGPDARRGSPRPAPAGPAKSTGIDRAGARPSRAAATVAALTFQVAGSMSANVGVAPT